MARSARLADLEIRPLSESEAPDLEEFTCGDTDLDDFIRADAPRLQAERAIQAYVARRAATGRRVLGYVALLADAVILEQKERKTLGLRDAHPAIPAIKIARLAVASDLQRGNGVGTALVRFSYFTAATIAGLVGCRLLTLDAYPQSIGFYERLGFVRNRSKEYRERQRPSMRLDLFSRTRPPWI